LITSVNTTVAALAAQKLTEADEQLVASTLKLTEAADRLRTMLRGTLVALVIVASSLPLPSSC
jgi:hypothetical protein